ncbi:hypothetical protein [Sorangium sp. So ce1000]|uniref:hypothetical protein n=1 Tax=Sorangium sp. So ce1000 TaxID=3133325 RepID=UPI003F63EEF8
MADQLRLAELVDRSTFRVGDQEHPVGMTGKRITGARVVLEQVLRAWLTDRGTLRHAPTVGFNVSRLLNASSTATSLRRYEAVMVAEARAVEFVADARVTLRIVERELLLSATVTLVDGTTYPLAVRLSEAGAVIEQIGA